MSAHPQPPAENPRIESWKNIAAYLGRDERTVKRWERDRALPVHRMPGARGGVFAYPSELDAWFNSARDRQPILPPAVPPAFFETVPQLRPSLSSSIPLQASPSVGQKRGTRTVMVSLVCGIAILIGVYIVMSRSKGGSTFVSKLDPEKSTKRIEAEEFYLTGRYYWNQRSPAGLNRAVDSFTQAVIHDPSYAQAYAGLAAAYDLMPEYGSMPNDEAFPRALAAAKKAIELDNSLPEAHRALAFSEFFGKWDVSDAMSEYRKAIALDPHDAESHHWYATALLTTRRFPEAMAEIEKARQLDPSSRSILADEGLMEVSSGESIKGMERLKNLERSEPELVSVHRFLASAYFDGRNFPEFIAESERAALISGDTQEIAIATAARKGWQRGGERAMGDDLIEAQRKFFEAGRSSGFDLARVYAAFGRKEEAIAALQAAFRAHDYMVMTIFGGQLNEALHGNPQFEQLKFDVRARMDGLPAKTHQSSQS